MMVTSTSTTRLCSKCGQVKPVGEFRRRARDSEHRHHECNTCFALGMRMYRAMKRLRGIESAVAQLQHAKDIALVAAFLQGIFAQFGGMESFCRQWKVAFDEAARRRPGSRFVLNTLRDIGHMISLTDMPPPAPPERDLTTLSDEELKAEVRATYAEAESLLRRCNLD
jgi:hypothetical protein